MKELPLIKGRGFATVDDEAFPLAEYFKNWNINKSGNVICSRHKGSILLHILLYGRAPNGFDWDHINRDKLDNCRENLRIATRSQNKANSVKHRDNTSGFKGVCFDKSRNRWLATLGFNGKQLYLGRYRDKKEAALAYDNAAKEHFGEFAVTNL